jgi:hypothetical protein
MWCVIWSMIFAGSGNFRAHVLIVYNVYFGSLIDLQGTNGLFCLPVILVFGGLFSGFKYREFPNYKPNLPSLLAFNGILVIPAGIHVIIP